MENKKSGLSEAEKIIEEKLLEATGANSIEEVHAAMGNPGSKWPGHFKINRAEAVSLAWKLMEEPESAMEIAERFTGAPAEKMREEVKKTMKQEGWKDETGSRKESLAVFLQKHFDLPYEKRPRYDSVNELHFSGTNPDVLSAIKGGVGEIEYVNVLYKDGKPTQIHVVFRSENNGHNIDVYLQKRALEDFLASK